MTSQETLNKIRSIFARAAHTTFEGEFTTAYEMATRMMERHGIDEWDVCYTPYSSRTEADYILHNFRTAKARWDAMDEAKAKEGAKTTHTSTERPKQNPEKEPEPGYKLVWVNGHERRSKKGTVYQVAGHYRKVKVRTKG